MALRTLYQSLLDSDPARLRIIARQWEIQLAATRKADIAAELVDAMASAETVSRVLEALAPPERAALDDLLRQAGELPWTIYVRRWGEVRSLGPGRVEREALWQAPVSAAERLWFLGLVQRAFAERSDQPVEMAFLPEELQLYMPPPAPQPVPPPPEAPVPAHAYPGTDALVEHLVTLWTILQRGGQPGDITLPMPQPAARERLALLVTLSLEQGWLRQQGEMLRPAGSPVLSWLRSDPWTQWKALLTAWRTSRRWNDLAYVPSLTPDPVKGWPNIPEETREAILEILTRCQPERWYELPTFTAYVKAKAPDFLRPAGDYDTWAPRDAQTETPLRGFEAWDAVEGALLTYLVSDPLHWLGWVDLGSSLPAAPPTSFRLTVAGAALLDLGPPPDLPPAPPLQLKPGGEIEVPRRRRYERFQISRVADIVQSDTPYRYRLSPTSLTQARSQRIPYDRIIEFLEEATDQQTLPTSLKAAIERGYQGRDRVILDQRWVVRVEDPAHLQIPRIAALIKEQLTPTIALIRRQDRDQIVRLLAEFGLLADIETGS